jgi:hypothetical protein
VGSNTDHLSDLYRIGLTAVACSQPTHKAGSERAVFASSAGRIMGVSINGNRRICLPNREPRPPRRLLSPIHERKSRAGQMADLATKKIKIVSEGWIPANSQWGPCRT